MAATDIPAQLQAHFCAMRPGERQPLQFTFASAGQRRKLNIVTLVTTYWLTVEHRIVNPYYTFIQPASKLFWNNPVPDTR